ncbi:MAG: CotH kinase family protein [Chryseolinea sp.]
MRNYTVFAFIFVLLIVYPCFSQTPGQQLFDNSKIHEIKISSLYESLTDTLTKNYLLSFGFGQIQTRKIPYATSLLTIDGTVMDTIGVRYKGFNSWWNSVKKPIKIDLNKYKDQEYDGLSKFNLHNGSGDPSFVRENISYNLLRLLGIKAPRTAYAKVYMDNTYLGLYRLVEQVDNTFLDVNFGNHEGNLYVQQSKGSGGFVFDWISNNQEDYYESLELENHQKTNDWSSLIHFLDVLNHTPDASFRNEIQAVFDVDEYLQILAFEVVINNLDWYGNSGRNYYLAEVNGKFHWVPWDYNLSWREDAKPINISAEDYPILIKRILNVPEFYNRFLRKYCELLPLLSNASFNALVDNEVAMIKPLMEVDPFLDYSYEAFETNAATTWENKPGLKEFAAQRYTDITSTLQSLHLDCSVITDIPEGEESSLEMYPIPAKDILYIELFPNKEMQVTIVNGLGQVVLQTKVNETGSVDVRQLPAGCYVLKASIGNKIYSRLLLVEH